MCFTQTKQLGEIANKKKCSKFEYAGTACVSFAQEISYMIGADLRESHVLVI